MANFIRGRPKDVKRSEAEFDALFSVECVALAGRAGRAAIRHALEPGRSSLLPVRKSILHSWQWRDLDLLAVCHPSATDIKLLHELRPHIVDPQLHDFFASMVRPGGLGFNELGQWASLDWPEDAARTHIRRFDRVRVRTLGVGVQRLVEQVSDSGDRLLLALDKSRFEALAARMGTLCDMIHEFPSHQTEIFFADIAKLAGPPGDGLAPRAH